MGASIHPGDLQGLRIMELAKLTAVDMTTTAAFNVLNNGNRTKTARDLGVDPRTIFRHLEKGEGGEEGGLPGNGSHDGEV